MSQGDPIIKEIPIHLPSTKLRTVCFADVEAKPINWLWPDKIARGKLTLISGDPGLGKSLITVALASVVSTGARWPVGGGRALVGSVILMSDEDSKADTIRPRLDAAGADCSKVHGMQMVQEITEDGEIFNRGFSLASDIDRLAKRVEEIGDVALIQIDPISAYLGGTDSHKNADVRALLSPLSNLAEKFNVAVVVVTHLNKGSGSAIYRSVGSIAFTAAARTAWVVTKDKDDHSRRLLLPVKNNIGNDHTGLAYRVETASNDAPVVMWEQQPVEIDINEALNSESDDMRSERDDAREWLESELYNGPVSSKDLQARAREAGHSWSTVKRSKKDLGVVAKKNGMRGGWEWYHPDDLPAKNEEDHEENEGDQPQNVDSFGFCGSLREDSEDNEEVNL
jgi:putative DNA primase/helicase